MMRKIHSPSILSSQKGFTLLEILIAITLFGMVITIVLFSFAGATGNVESVQNTISVYESAKGAMDRMVLDLESIRVTMPPKYSKPPSQDDLDPWQVVCTTESVGDVSLPVFRFVSQAHVDLTGTGRKGLAEITYYVTPDPGKEGALVLRRRDIVDWEIYENLPELGSDPILCSWVRGLEFLFYDQDLDTIETWDSESEDVEFATPVAVDIILELSTLDDEESVPYRFETSVNLPFYREEVE